MQKILIINSLYYPYIGGGAEIICQEQAEMFHAKGYHVTVLTTDSHNLGLQQDEVNHIDVYRAGIKNVYWHYKNKPNRFLRMLWHTEDIYNVPMKQYVSKVINIEKPDIVFCHNITGFSISIWDEIKRHGLPIVQVLHDQYFFCANSNAFKNGQVCEKQCFSCHILRLPHRNKSQQVDAVVGVSQYVLSRMVNNGYFTNSKQMVIHNARHITDPGQKQPWDGKSPFVIGYIGTLSKVKGVEWLIKSFMKLNINAQLIIAGNGEKSEYEQYLKDMAKPDTRISFSGYVNSTDHYSHIHVTVVPSLWLDTFPTVAFESCANHVPVIASNVGGLPEIIKDGLNGILIDNANLESLSDAIIQLYNNYVKLNTYMLNARDSVHEFIDMKRVESEYLTLIEYGI